MRVKSRLGNVLSGIVVALSDEPQSTRAWKRGALVEQKLADSLARVPGLHVLHDRKVPHTQGNIDHILIASAGVFVVDAKYYQGLIRVRDRGGIFNTDPRLLVGTRDCSHLATRMGWQVEAVARAVTIAGFRPPPPITPVLCFVDGEWPLFSPPESYQGVRLEGTRSIRKLISQAKLLDQYQVDRVARALAIAFPGEHAQLL